MANGCVDGGASPDLSAGGGRVSERSAGIGVGAAGAADPWSDTRRATAQERGGKLSGEVAPRAAGAQQVKNGVHRRPGLREPCRNPGHLRYPRLHPTGSQAACQSVGSDDEGLQSTTAVLRRRPAQRQGRADSGRSDPHGLTGSDRPNADLRLSRATR